VFDPYFYIQEILTCSLLIVSIPDRSVVYQAPFLALVSIMSLFQLLQRSYKALFNPPDRGSKENAVRFGLLGASTIASVPPRILH
jgi:hypothetical protein